MSYGPFIRLLAAAITVQPAAGESSSCDMDSPVQARSKSGQGTHGPVNGHLPPQQDSELPPASWRLPVGGSTQTGAHESADPSSSQHGSGAAAVPEAEPLNGAQQPAEPSAVGSSSSSRQQQGPASPEGPPLLSGREATCAAHESEEALLSTIRACGSFQGAFVELLHLREGVLTSAAVRVLVALLQSKAVTTGVLDAAGGFCCGARLHCQVWLPGRSAAEQGRHPRRAGCCSQVLHLQVRPVSEGLGPAGMPVCCGRDTGCWLLKAAGTAARVCLECLLAGAGG